MALDLIDLGRLKITAETDAWLQKQARFTGKTKQEVLREFAHQHAVQEIREARLLVNLAPGEGREGESRGAGK